MQIEPTPVFARQPMISFDLDGVLSRPMLGQNFAISRALELATPPLADVPTPHAPPRRRVKPARVLFDHLRYAVRSPMPGAREALARIAERQRVVVVTARGWWMRDATERWLVRHGLRPHLEAVYLNHSHLPSAVYKLLALRSLGIDTHLDDDGSIAYYLARNGVPRVYLQDWPRNRGLPYPATVRVVGSLADLATDLSHPAQWHGVEPLSAND